MKKLRKRRTKLCRKTLLWKKNLKEACANTNWGASTSLLAEIARDSFDYSCFCVIMRYVWEAVGDKPSKWRRVLKTLTLIDYLCKNGTERVVEEVREGLYRIRVLMDFHVTEDGRDKGGSIREKAKWIVELVNDEELLKAERTKCLANRHKFVGIGGRGERTGPIPFPDNYDNSFGSFDYRSGIESAQGGRTGSGDRHSTRQDSERRIREEYSKDARRDEDRAQAIREKAKQERKQRRNRRREEDEDVENSRRDSKSENDERSGSGNLLDFDLFSSGNQHKENVSSQPDAFSTSSSWDPFPTATPAPHHGGSPAHEQFGNFVSAAPSSLPPQSPNDDFFGGFQSGSVHQAPMFPTDTQQTAQPSCPRSNSQLLDNSLFASAVPTGAPMNQQPQQSQSVSNNPFATKPFDQDMAHKGKPENFFSDINASLMNFSLSDAKKQPASPPNARRPSSGYNTASMMLPGQGISLQSQQRPGMPNQGMPNQGIPAQGMTQQSQMMAQQPHVMHQHAMTPPQMLQQHGNVWGAQRGQTSSANPFGNPW
eukprot:Selendium_serpulae@DN4685_c0_g1_i2.p1